MTVSRLSLQGWHPKSQRQLGDVVDKTAKVSPVCICDFLIAEGVSSLAKCMCFSKTFFGATLPKVKAKPKD
jgi:hypothetical protein